MKRFVFLFFVLIGGLSAQTPASVRMEGFSKRMSMKAESPYHYIRFENVGPTVMSGRVVDVEVSPDDPTIFYVAYASGSVWKTENNGTSFVPVFEGEATPTIGDIAVNWEQKILYVGTGENNSSRSSYAGTGIYRSSDDGKTWQNLGLSDSHHISRILLHPTQHNTLWVAALGHLYSPNEERGIFKSVDGGLTWEKVLYIDDNTGGVDILNSPTNPDELYAAMWYRTRKAWHFQGSGKTSGIYKSMDGGKNWSLVSNSESGFPQGEGIGRIGLAISRQSEKLYAFLDNQTLLPENNRQSTNSDLNKTKLRSISRADFLRLPKVQLENFLRTNRFPERYSANKVLQMVSDNEIAPIDLVHYLEDANANLFDAPIVGGEVYVSTNQGQTWKKTHRLPLENVVFTYGYYFGQIRVAPQNPDKVYVLGVPIIKSEDGGATWKSINGDNVHVDHHALWVNPNREGHLVNGNDGGVNISYDDGESWIKANHPPVGQFYAVNVDNAQPFNIYGGLQDNGVWWGSHQYRSARRWHGTGAYPYKELLGGDGMQVQVDPRDNETLYTGFQFGNYFRMNKNKSGFERLSIEHNLGERPLRWNWQTPILLSPHQPDILYIGSHKLHRSLDKGKTFDDISGDLTQGGKTGNVPYGTLTTIDESKLKFGQLVVGSDDGLIHLSIDGGTTWQRISDSLPKDLWVSRVRFSNVHPQRIYVSLNGYREDDFTPYVYRSDDLGQHWQNIGAGLPLEPVNVVLEDPVNPNVLYVGTDLGLYVSVDGGNQFSVLSAGLPHTPVHDLAVQARDGKLVVGTHGRSIYMADVRLLQGLNDELTAKSLWIFPIENRRWEQNWGKQTGRWGQSNFNEPKMSIWAFSQKEGRANFSVYSGAKLLYRQSIMLKKGINEILYDLQSNEGTAAENGNRYLGIGKYQIKLQQGTNTVTQELEITSRPSNPSPDAKPEPDGAKQDFERELYGEEEEERR